MLGLEILVSVCLSGFSPVESLLRETAGTTSSPALCLHVGGRSQPAIAMASTSSLSWIFSLGPWGPLSSTEETEKRLSDQLFGLLLYSVVSDSLSVSLCQINSFPANLLPWRTLMVEDTRRLSAFRSVFMALKRGHLIN